MGYTKAVIKGISWVAGLRFTTRIISFLRIAILARILTPSEFGLVGIASLSLSLIDTFTETGINIFLIQEGEIRKYISTAWIISIVRGLIIGLIIIALTPIIVAFFKVPSAYFILMLISLVPLIKGFINPSVILFQKELKFKNEFLYRILIFFFDSLTAVILAFITKSAVSIILGLIVGASLEVFLSFKFFELRPRLLFNKTIFKEIITRGKWVTTSGIFNYLYHNIDNSVVGKVLGATQLGLYDMIYKISIIPITEVADVLSKVTFPVYAKIANDRSRLKVAFGKSFIVTLFASGLLGILFFLFPKPIILLFLGEKWIMAAPVLKILSIFGVVRAVSGSASALFFATNKQGYVSIVTFASFLAMLILVIPLTNQFGLTGTAYSAVFSSLIVLPIIGYFLLKILLKNEKS